MAVWRDIAGLVFAGVLLSGTAGPAGAWETECRAHTAGSAPTVEVSVVHTPAVHDFTRSRGDLKRISRDVGDAIAPGRYLDGLTVSELGYRITAQHRAIRIGGRVYCLWPYTIGVELTNRHSTVYVARRYRPDSCAFRAILEHEHVHLAINQQVLHDHRDRLRRDLRRAVRMRFPLFGTDLASLRRDAVEHLEDALLAALEPLWADRDERNAAVDTPDSYRAVHARCDRW